MLEKHLQDLLRYDKDVVDGWSAITKERVISHRDLDPKNIMWQGETLYVIDWEAAGYVNPYQELMEVLNYWIMEKTGEYCKEKFEALLQGYTEYIDICKVDWKPVINSSFDGMLGWLAYNLKRCLGLEGTGEDERVAGWQQVQGTISELKKYEKQIEVLEKWIREFE